MPKIEQEISSQAKKIYNKLKKEHGAEFVLENILNEYKEFENAVSENEKLSTRLEKSKEKISELKKLVEESRSTIKETPSMSNPDIITALNETITTIKSLNESYARENERLLKIVNFSEYDEKVNGLTTEIAELTHMCANLKKSLKGEKEKSVNFEVKSIKLIEEKTEAEAVLESSKKESARLVEKVAAAEGAKAQLESTVTSYVEELRRYKAMVEELKSQAPLQAEQQESETPAYS